MFRRFLVRSAFRNNKSVRFNQDPAVATTASSSKCPASSFVASPGGCAIEEEVPPSATSIVFALGKLRLTALVAATAVCGSVICAPAGMHLIPLALGTSFQGLSANTVNQCIEVECDRLMKRTSKRPLVTGAITRPNALMLAGAELAIGTALLYYYCPAAAMLGFLNWALYVGVYTPSKRITVVNTEIGAVVGAIPPVMGGVIAGTSFAACAPAYWLGAIMFAWQIPHFMSLSYYCRRDYNEAGFRMRSFVYPDRATFYAVVYSGVLQTLILVGPLWIGMNLPLWYYASSAVLTTIMVAKSAVFYLDPNRYCRGCFVYSYIFLALQLVVMMVAVMYERYTITSEEEEALQQVS
eukprot:PhF_6_TR40585/c0_g1_i1/m.60858/K02257/COX10; protoheme IX farnesyltransferase